MSAEGGTDLHCDKAGSLPEASFMQAFNSRDIEEQKFFVSATYLVREDVWHRLNLAGFGVSRPC